jgi:hypothetical protein
MTEEPAVRFRPNERGINALRKLEDGKRVGAVLNEGTVSLSVRIRGAD